ncbi:hypothetical protein HY032_00650, partial [Candidatus Gottesmanbacteria bacterium]|nr:hypothetical protein [Candidatus Gottesmanbacteria bacterium]
MKSLVTRLLALLCVVILGISIFNPPVHARESWAVPSVTGVADAIKETVDGVIQKEGSE